MENISKDIEAAQKAIERFTESVINFTRTLGELCSGIAIMINKTALKNNRVLQQAKYARKIRTRKKNINRFIKLIEKEYNCQLLEWQKESIRRLINERRTDKGSS